jgi:hypothetical protein
MIVEISELGWVGVCWVVGGAGVVEVVGMGGVLTHLGSLLQESSGTILSVSVVATLLVTACTFTAVCSSISSAVLRGPDELSPALSFRPLCVILGKGDVWTNFIVIQDHGAKIAKL